MEVCDYPCVEQDPSSLLSQLGQHPDDMVSHLPCNLIPMPAPSPVEKCDQIVVLDSSRIAMQIAAGQIVWPIIPKPKETIPKLEPDVYPFSNGAVHPDLESTDLALGQMDTPLEKCKVRKRPRSASEDVEGIDGEGPNERQAIMRWKDTWVAQLIQVRGRMQAAFSGPQKQRIDLWQVIKNEMARTCPGFDKDSEACRKKWRRVYKEYRDEKTLHNGADGSQKCRFYELLEHYMGEGADGASDPPACLALSVKDEAVSVKSEAGEADIGEANAVRKPRKRVKNQVSSTAESESLHSMVLELVGISKEMLQTTRQFEQDKLEVLHSLRETLREISGKI